MKPITYQQVRRAAGAFPLTPRPRGSVEFSAICTDSRKLEKGSLFVALRGENFDGHQFLATAAAGGALGAIVDHDPADRPPGMHLMKVADTRRALGKLARAVRASLRGKVIAVGGSNGKTGTKHLIDSVLSARFRGTYSPKSFNNDIGVPLAIFPADPAQDYLVLELGTNHRGEMSILSDIARPDIAVITNCSAEHLEGLGDLEGVRREEACIIEGLHEQGLLIVNGDDARLLEIVRPFRGRRVNFGFNPGNDLVASDVRCAFEGTRFRLNSQREVFVPLMGRHTACNALAAVAVGRAMGMDEAAIIDALSHAHGPEMRLEIQQLGAVTLINDAYNANPASMKSALETLWALPGERRRIAIVGDMRELGEWSDTLHRELGQFAAARPPDRLICVGEKAGLIAEAARSAGMSADRVTHLPDTATAAKVVPEWLADGDLVLIKASRYMKLESVGAAISAALGRRAAS